MKKYNIPTAWYEVFDDPARACAYLRALSVVPSWWSRPTAWPWARAWSLWRIFRRQQPPSTP
ncbi:MAG: hypothetical protein V8R75_16100 [Oscillospiraceae bacterium]